MKRFIGILGLGLLLTILGSAPVGAAVDGGETPDPFHEKLTREGIEIDVTIDNLREDREPGELRRGDEIEVRVEIQDTLQGSPMTRLYPAGWLDRLPDGGEDNPDPCKKKVETFIGGGFLGSAELDLNVYYVLALNDEASISVVDPLFGFGGSKLVTTVLLDSPGEDWEMPRSDDLVYVSMPKSNQVAVVDTATFEVTRNVPVGPLPTRMRLQPDERYLWVTYEGGPKGFDSVSGVSVVDTRSLEEVARIETGRGRHEIVLSGDDRLAFVSNERDGTVAVIDVSKLEKVAVIETGKSPTSMAYSSVADAVFVTDRETGEIAVVDAKEPKVVGRIEAEEGLGQIRFAPYGRLGFAVNPKENLVHIVDAATRTIVQTGETEKGPDQVTFSDELAYLRHRGSDIVLMVPLGQIGREGEPVPVIDFPGGHQPAGAVGMPSSAETIVQAPGASAVLVANPLDKMIYYYKEGMAAPMGEFKNYGRQPRAVEVVDKSLREVEPGVYRSTTRLRKPGNYELALFVDSPRVVACLPVTVQENPELIQASLPELAVTLEAERDMILGESTPVRVRVTDRETGAPRDDIQGVRVMAMLTPGIWHHRFDMESKGDGVYEMELTPPRAGVYYVFSEILSEGMPLQQSPSVVIEVAKPKTETEAAGR